MEMRDVENRTAPMQQAICRLNISAYAYHRTLKFARNIVDLEECDAFATKHIAEAVQYRRLNF